MSVPRERVKQLSTNVNEEKREEDVDLIELIEQRNQQIQNTFQCFNESSSFSNLLSDMPKFDS